MVRRSIHTVTLNNLTNLPTPCRSCGYWEQAEPASIEEDFPEGNHPKEGWYDNVLSNWGDCGKLVVQSEQALAYCQYAPPDFLPQLDHYRFGPVSADAIFLACLYVAPDYRGRGLGKLLVNAVQKDLIKRGYRAVETFARRVPAKNPSGWTEFYLANGWQVIRDSGSLALLRLDLRTSISWQTNLESVLEGLVLPVPHKIKMPALP